MLPFFTGEGVQVNVGYSCHTNTCNYYFYRSNVYMVVAVCRYMWGASYSSFYLETLLILQSEWWFKIGKRIHMWKKKNHAATTSSNSSRPEMLVELSLQWAWDAGLMQQLRQALVTMWLTRLGQASTEYVKKRADGLHTGDDIASLIIGGRQRKHKNSRHRETDALNFPLSIASQGQISWGFSQHRWRWPKMPLCSPRLDDCHIWTAKHGISCMQGESHLGSQLQQVRLTASVFDQ